MSAMTNYATPSGITTDCGTADRVRRVEDDYFHLPPEAFGNPGFLRTADAARFLR